jgi:hypothetical protein
MRFLRLASIAVALSCGLGAPVMAVSCSPESKLDSDATDRGASGPGNGGAGGGSASGGSPSTGGDGVGAGLDPDAACGSIHEAANVTPLNLYIMVDRSTSMDTAGKWDAAKAGLAAFLNDPASAGAKVGINFFPKAGMPSTCDQNVYKTPVVDFGLLPGNAAPIIAAMDAQTPSGFDSPVFPALGGAILKGIEIAENAAGESAAVLLVTDGEPQGPGTTCANVDPNDPQEIANLAAVGYAYDPPVVTFVVGLPGVNQTFANLVAQSGGSGAAILVGATNVEVEFQKALSQVLGQALPCEFEIPVKVELGEYEINQVNVEVTPGGGEAALVPQNADCEGGEGWYYDDAIPPDKIILCPGTCATLKGDLQAAIDILLGCQTIIK